VLKEFLSSRKRADISGIGLNADKRQMLRFFWPLWKGLYRVVALNIGKRSVHTKYCDSTSNQSKSPSQNINQIYNYVNYHKDVNITFLAEDRKTNICMMMIMSTHGLIISKECNWNLHRPNCCSIQWPVVYYYKSHQTKIFSYVLEKYLQKM